MTELKKCTLGKYTFQHHEIFKRPDSLKTKHAKFPYSGFVQLLERSWVPVPQDLLQEAQPLQLDHPPFTVSNQLQVENH